MAGEQDGWGVRNCRFWAPTALSRQLFFTAYFTKSLKHRWVPARASMLRDYVKPLERCITCLEPIHPGLQRKLHKERERVRPRTRQSVAPALLLPSWETPASRRPSRGLYLLRSSTEGCRKLWDQLNPLDSAPLPSMANQRASRHSTLLRWRGAWPLWYLRLAAVERRAPSP